MRWRLVLWAAFALVGTLGATACADIFGFDRFVAAAPDGSARLDGGIAEAGPDATPVNACGRIGVPDRPTADAGALADPVGLNLDSRCTYARADVSCDNASTDETFAESILDKPDGVDNAGDALLRRLALSYDELSAEKVNARLRGGEFGLVARLDGYNGGDDDTDVQVAVQPAIGVLPTPGSSSPKFSSSDTWVADKRYFFGGEITRPRFVSARGYVRGKKLVAYFKELLASLTIPSGGRNLDILIDEAWITGDVSRKGGELYLDNGIIAGRWQTARLVRAVGELQLFGTPICKTPVQSTILGYVCDAQDLARTSGEPVDTPCAAISVGFRFAAVPANAATFARPPADVVAPVDVCPAATCP